MRHILFTLLICSSVAHAETWLPVTSLESKGDVLFLDTDSIVRSGDAQQAWFKTVYRADQPIQKGHAKSSPDVKSYRYEMNLGHFDCSTRKMAVSQSILHAADGQVVGSIKIDERALQLSQPDIRSVGSFMVQVVCDSATSGQPPTGLATITTLANPDDFYPSGPRGRGERGAPVVRVCVAPSGALLRDPELAETSSFPDLDAAAIKAAKAMRYKPAVPADVAAPESCIRFKIKFGSRIKLS